MPSLLISELTTATPVLTDFIEFEPAGLVTKKTTFQAVKDLISGTITANNALTMSTPTNVQLGADSALISNSPLLHDTFINAGTFVFQIGSATSEVLKVNSTTAGNVATITNSGNGNALFAITQGGIALLGQSTYSSTSAVEEILRLNRLSSGTAANGIGAKLVFNVETSATTSKNSGNIISTFTNVTDASRSASMRFEVTSAAVVLQRYCIFGSYTALTEGTATAVVRVNVPASQVTGGELLFTVEANDGTEFQSRTLRVIFTAVNKGGTTTVTLGTVEEVVAVSSGTLTVAITAVDAGSGNVDFKADATSSLTQTVLRAQCHLLKNFGSGTITSNN